MRIFKNIAHRLELAIIDEDGAFVPGLVVSFDVRRCSDNVSVASGVMSEVAPAYTATVTPTGTGDYRVIYTSPAGYENGFESLTVDDYDNFKANVSALALQTTANDIKAHTDLLPAVPAAAGAPMTLTAGERQDILNTLLLTADTIESGVSMRTSMRTLLALFAGIASGGGTNTINFKNPAGTDSRVSMVVDVDGNRSSTELLG